MGPKTYPSKKRRRRTNSSRKVVGYLKKSKINRFAVFDDKTKTYFKIASKELRKGFLGDKVECSLNQRGWVVIDKVIESNTNYFIGRIEKAGGRVKAFPLGSGRFSAVVIRGKISKKIQRDDLVKVKITRQPMNNFYATGKIDSVLDKSNQETKANEIAILKFNLRTNWSKRIINELRLLTKKDVDHSPFRKNLTKLPFVTIDGKDAKDFDDAVYAEKDNKGIFSLYVSIADVANYVNTESFIDKEAKKRGTSTYFTNRVLPMLPEQISNELCSLKPNEERKCLVCKIKLDKEGTPKETVFFEGLIKSRARLTYSKVSEYFETEDYPKKYGSSLKCLKEIFGLLKEIKKERGALDLDIPGYVPMSVEGKVYKFIKVKRNLAHKVIEECMLLANISAAEILRKSNIPSIYRIHPKPNYQNIKGLEAFSRTRSINIKIKPEGNVKDFYKLAEIALGRKDKEIIHMQILQSLNLATYSEKPSEHFALAYNLYTHFTSPIRRYPDLMVHRAIKALLRQSPNNKISLKEVHQDKGEKKNYPYNWEDIAGLAYDSSLKERLAEEATRDADNTMKCELALEKIDKVFHGSISGITNFGIFIHLKDLGIEGLCHISNFPNNDYYFFDEISKSLVGRNSGQGYFLGNSVSVKIKNVEVSSHRIDLEITK